MKRSVLFVAVFGVLLTFVLTGSALAEAGATLTTDKPDYLPGEVAIISGAGFLSGELIDLSIAIQDPDTGEWIADWEWAQGDCDEAGAFTAEYLVPDQALAKSVRATAMGLRSGLMATVEFTDAAAANVNFATSGLPAGTSVEVEWSGTNNGGQAISGPTTFTSPGPTSNIGTGQGTQFTYEFPSSVDVGGDTYILVSDTPGSPFTTPTSSPPVPATAVVATYELYVPPTLCPVNHAPTITASDLDLGQVVGCLVGGAFQYTVDIKTEDFSPDTSDSDGDPVTVSLDVSQVTLMGPGADEVDVTLTATDDPSARNVAGCDPLVPMSDTTTVKVTAQIVYNFVGFLSPLADAEAAVARIVKRGSTVPVKFQLYDCSGTPIVDLAGGDPHEISVAFWTEEVPNGVAVDVSDAGSSNSNGSYFRFDDPNWIYNLQTKQGYATNCTYKISAMLNDGTTHDAYISIKK